MARPRIPDETRARIADEYARGESTLELARRYGVSADSVGKIARAAGVPVRDRQGRPRPPQPDSNPVPYDGGWCQDGLIRRPLVNVRRASQGEGS